MTIFSQIYNDVYFSAHDGLAEKRHVFLAGNGLPDRWKNRDDFVVFEAGFGTGLSFLATAAEFLRTTAPHQRLHFLSAEAHPLTVAQIETALHGWSTELGSAIRDLTVALPRLVPGWHRIILWERVYLTLMIGDIATTLPEINTAVDAWYLDGFTPAKNPAMWGSELFDHMPRLSATGATAATYSAARVVKDGLQRAGFAVRKEKGFGYKSDMLAATLIGQGKPPITPTRNQRIVIQGGGLAGTALAHELKADGHQPIIIAPNGLADAASGNPRGLYNPRFAKSFGPMAHLYASGFSAIQKFLADNAEEVELNQCGTLHLLRDEAGRDKIAAIRSAWGWGDDDARIITAVEAGDIAGIPVGSDCLYLPFGGSVSPRALCARYAAGIPVSDKDVAEADIRIIATGQGLKGLMPAQIVRGQVSFMRANDLSRRIKTNLCYGGYLSPAWNGTHVLGSTFQHWLDTPDIRAEDHAYVRTLLHQYIGEIFAETDTVGGRVGFRVSMLDRVPVIGRLTTAATPTYISGAHGSHGIVTSLMAARLIADQISGTPPCLPRTTIKALDPQRFFAAEQG